MFYQLRLNVFMSTLPELSEIKSKIAPLLPRLKVVNPRQLNQEVSTIDLIQCHHDTNPAAPCELIAHWDNAPTP